MGSRKYDDKVYEYIKVRQETTNNKTLIARELKTLFQLDDEVENIRNIVRRASKKPAKIKRLFFDIETSKIKFWGWRTGKQWVGHHQVEEDKRIICISYKWQYEDKVRTLKWDKSHDDSSIIRKFISEMGKADEIVAHNGDRFDIKELRTRAIQEGILMFPKYRTLDTLKKARKYFNFHSNKLDYIGEVLQVGRKLDHEGHELWTKVMNNDKDALDRMIKYCITPDHKLLKDDMRWHEARNLNVGDVVLGFDEKSSISKRRLFRSSTITKINYDTQPVYLVRLSSGKEFKVTKEHKWLVRGSRDGNGYVWRRTDELINKGGGVRISKVMDMWEEVDTKDAGWLSGMFDGEGCLSKRGNTNWSGNDSITNLSISQRPTPTLGKIERILNEMSTLHSKRRTAKGSDCVTLNIYGHKHEKLKFLGEIRPERLLDKFTFDDLGSFECRAGDEFVESVELLGDMEIIQISTDTGTFICDGYAHHNCEQDVILLEDVFHVMSPYIDHNTNHAIQVGGHKYDCPECTSINVSLCHTDTTPMGYIKRHMKCHDCKKQYPISNKSYLSFLTK